MDWRLILSIVGLVISLGVLVGGWVYTRHLANNNKEKIDKIEDEYLPRREYDKDMKPILDKIEELQADIKDADEKREGARNEYNKLVEKVATLVGRLEGFARQNGIA